MKRGTGLFLVLILAVCMIGVVSISPVKSVAKEGMPTAMAIPDKVELDGDSQIIFVGTGFQPGEEIHLTIVTADGITTGLEITSNPQKPVPDERGMWATAWKLDRFATKGFIKAGSYKVSVMDADYVKALAEVTVTFVAKK